MRGRGRDVEDARRQLDNLSKLVDVLSRTAAAFVAIHNEN